ncbi:MAG: tetratricopeptide repeat protein [bacterium]|nr:tetratricopeptide repeat protein [bacterium]
MKRLPRLLTAFVLFGLMAGSMEFLLGFLHLERYDPEFTPRSSFPLFILGEGEYGNDYVTNPHFRGALSFQKFARRKETGVFRIFVLGGSAAYGWPGEERDSFTGYLRRSLDTAAPGRFEIVNVAGMSYGSHRVLDLLKDVIHYGPDLVVVYSGNNEYVERNVLPPGEREGGAAYAVRNRLSRMNIYRAIRLVIRKTPGLGRSLSRSRDADITDLRSNPAVNRGTLHQSFAVNEQVSGNYRRNLSEMARILGERNIRSVFCSVPVNLDSWRPAEPPLRFGDRNEALRWAAKAKEGEGLLSKDPARAADLFGELLRMKSDWAPGAYYRGKALEAKGDFAAALEMLRIARDTDARPVRAFGSFNDAVREVAASGRDAQFLDLEAIFREKSPNGITGDTLVRDYCHPTEVGHKLIATVLLPVILSAARVEGIRQAVENAIALDPTARMKDPKTLAGELYSTGMTYFFGGRPREAEKVYQEVLRINPGHLAAMNNLGNIYVDQRRLPEARALFLRALAIDPEYMKANYSMGVLLFYEGDLAGAGERMRKVLSLNPQYPSAFALLGDIAQRKGAFPEALEFYRKSMALGYENSHLHLMTGKALLAMGDNARALPELVKALEFDPANEEAVKLVETAR